MTDEADDWPDEYELASDAVKECAESVKDSNPDLSKSQAFAICQDMENKGQLQKPDEDNQELGADGDGLRVLAHDFDAPGPVNRVENEDESVTYQNILFLGPGEWTDAASGEQLFYSPEAIQKLASNPEERVVDTSVNVNHEHQDQLKQVGSFDRDSLEVDDVGNLYGDVTLHGRTTASEDAIELMDLALETDGEEGAGGVSVEIPMENEETEFDRERGMEKMVAFDLAGLAIVTRAASEPAAFEQQFADRAVAMADGEAPTIRVMHAADGHSLKSGSRQDAGMSLEDALQTLADADGVEIKVTGDNVDDIADALDAETEETPDDEPGQELEEEEEEEQTELQDGGEMDMVQDVIERAEGEGFETAERSAAELLQFVQENLDVSDEEMQALNDVADAYLQAVEAESLDATPAEGLLDFVVEQGGAEENGDGEEEEGGEMGGEELEAIEEELAELREEKEDLERRLEELESESKESRTLRETAGKAENGSESGGVPTRRVSRHGGRIVR